MTRVVVGWQEERGVGRWVGGSEGGNKGESNGWIEGRRIYKNI